MSQALLALFLIFLVVLALIAYWRAVLALAVVIALSIFTLGLVQVMSLVGGVR